MKLITLIFKFTLLAILTLMTSVSYGQYCTSGGPFFDTNADVESFAIIGANSSNINYTNDCFMPTANFQDETFTNVTLIGGTAYTGNVAWSGCPDPFTLIDNTGPSAGTIWIDWNGNTTFETSEVIHTWSGNSNGGSINETFTINTPSNVPNGIVRVRVSMEEGGTLPLDPCASFSYGSMIDFGVTISGNTFVPTSTLGTAQTCLGDAVEVPLTISDGDGIGAISYKVAFDTSKLEFVQPTNLHAHFSTNFNITNAATANASGEIIIGWYDGTTTTGQNFGTNTLLNLAFNTKAAGAAALNWITTTPYGELTDGLGNIISGSIFTDGTVTVNALPTAGLISSDADNTICTGESVTFTASGGGTYEFFLNNASQGVTSSTNTFSTPSLANGDQVKVVVTNANGCTDTSAAITTSITQGPNTFNVTGGGNYCSSNVVIGLDGSETGISYQLILNGNVIETITGTGSAINFTGVTTTNLSGDVYTVGAFATANTACSSTMTGTATVALNCFDVTVNLMYDNGQSQGLKNTNVVLYDNTGAQAGTGTTNNAGQVIFQNITNGTGYYILADLSGKPYGGINSTDALLIALDFANLVSLSGMKDRAGDIDENGTGNANDALQVANRFVGNPYTFNQDWLHDKDTTSTFTINNASVTMTALVLTFGDVNGSYDVSGLSNGTKSIVNVFNESELLVEEGTMIDIPFYTKDAIEAGAVSLVVNYPYDVFDIEKVTLNKALDNVIYEIKDGRIRLSWFSLQPIELEATEELFTITAKVHEDLTNAWTPTITFGNETELADAQGQVIEQINLTVPTILLPEQNILNFFKFIPTDPLPESCTIPN